MASGFPVSLPLLNKRHGRDFVPVAVVRRTVQGLGLSPRPLRTVFWPDGAQSGRFHQTLARTPPNQPEPSPRRRV